MQWRFAALGLLTACGRLAFDTTGMSGDATDGEAADSVRVCASPAGHDEDGDGTDDACDVCPHRIDDQRDSDGDGVGDACDPEPANPRQQIALFEPMLDNRNGWQVDNGVIDAGGAHLAGSGNYSASYRSLTDGTYLFELGGSVLSAPAGQQYHITITVQEMSAGRYFYCEILTQGTSNNMSWSYTLDGTTFPHDDLVLRTTTTAGASGTLSMSMTATDGHCDGTWGGETTTAVGMRHAIAAQQVSVGCINCDATVDWFVEIQTN